MKLTETVQEGDGNKDRIEASEEIEVLRKQRERRQRENSENNVGR